MLSTEAGMVAHETFRSSRWRLEGVCRRSAYGGGYALVCVGMPKEMEGI